MSRTKSLGAHSTMNNPNDYLVGLDIGSHKVLCSKTNTFSLNWLHF